ncbi:MAG: FHA domain-containing protein [Planctomycetes bacterium]|nr:FHA domain-containing protein [Planctomycetota bacterium]
MPIHIVVRVPRGSTLDVSEHTFTRSVITVGRSPECDLVLPGDELRVSRQHVRIERREGGYLMVDLGSRNGTLLNDNLIAPSSTHPLNETDVIKMGTVEVEVANVILDDNTKDKVRAIRKGSNTSGRRAAPVGASDPREAAALRAMQSISNHFFGKDPAAGQFTSPEQITLFGELIRVSLDILLEGLFQTLSARKEFEGEFDASVTMAFQRDSNPIKMMQELERFKTFPLNWQENRDVLEVKDSLERAIKDVNQHQMGLLAGMQQVLEAIIKRLDPIEIEKTALSKGGLLGRMSRSRLAWQEYLETYSEFLAESSKLFNEMIYPNLQKGYLLSHKDKTRIMQSAQNLQAKAEQVRKVAEDHAAAHEESDVGTDSASA